MRKFKFLTFCALSIFIFAAVGCNKEDDDGMGGGGNNSSTPITLGCSINNDETLTNHNADGVDYILDCNLDVIADLKVEPGTTIQVNDGYNITVESGGSLSAVGTAEMPISFQGQGGSGATWEYILFNTTNSNNRLNHVRIQNAGNNDGWSSLRSNTSAVFLEGRLSMTNTTISGSNGDGLTITKVIDASSLPEFSNNIFRDAVDYPIRVNLATADDLNFSSCTFSDNGESFILLSENAQSRIDEDVTLERAPLPYFVDADIFLREGGLTIESGNELVFASGTGIEISAGGEQFLRINGTDTNHVIMRGEVTVAESWLGILVATNNSNNIFDYLDIADGGQRNLSLVDQKGNIVMNSADGRLTLNDCTSTRAECDVVINTALGTDQTFENNSPSIANVCMD